MEDRGQQKPRQLTLEIHVPQEEIIFTFVRSSGAGGQNVNKVNSKAVLRWNALATSVFRSAGMRERFMQRYASRLTSEGDLVLMSDRHRDQGRNAADCMEKLREMLTSVVTPPKKRVATKPTYGSKQRRLKAKKVHSDKKLQRRIRDDD